MWNWAVFILTQYVPEDVFGPVKRNDVWCLQHVISDFHSFQRHQRGIFYTLQPMWVSSQAHIPSSILSVEWKHVQYITIRILACLLCHIQNISWFIFLETLFFALWFRVTQNPKSQSVTYWTQPVCSLSHLLKLEWKIMLVRHTFRDLLARQIQ